MPDFDPYYKWLAIPPSEQPPHHYRLLGLAIFEPDLDVVSAAADRQMAHIRSYQHGAHSAESQRLLNELSLARLTLLRPATKATYDAELKQTLGVAPAHGRPLKVAMPLHASDSGLHVAEMPKPAPMPLPMPLPAHAAPPARMPPQLAPSGLIRPQAMPAANAPPAHRHQPQTAETTNGDERPAAPAANQAERRRALQRSATFWTIFGVVGGGLMGTYIAGVILNFLGADLPDIARSFPGMRKRGAIVKPVESDKNDNENGRNTVKDQTSGTGRGEQQNPWAQRGPMSPVVLGAGSHNFYYVERNGRGMLRVESVSQSNNSKSTRSNEYPLASVMAASPQTVVDYYGTEKSLCVSAPSGGFATLVLPLRAAPECIFDHGHFSLRTFVGGNNPNNIVQAMITRRFDFNTWAKPTEILTEFPLISGKSSGIAQLGGSFTLRGAERELCLVAAMFVGAESRSDYVRLHLGTTPPSNTTGHFGSITVKSTRPDTEQSNPVVQTSPEINQPPEQKLSAEAVRIERKYALRDQQGNRPANLPALVEQARTQVQSEDPRAWLVEASKAAADDMHVALLTVAAEKAVAAGDVVLAATAYERANRFVSDDFTTEEARALKTLFQGNKRGFQPTAFAAWSVDVLERLANGKTPPPDPELVKMALKTAAESGDRDLLHRAARLAAGSSP